MPPVKRPCLTCNTPTQGTYCPTHTPRSPTSQRTNRERQRRRGTVEAWIQTHGHVCPGYGTPTHAALDLTADHIIQVADAGHDTPLQVLCRRCNSRKAADHTNTRRQDPTHGR